MRFQLIRKEKWGHLEIVGNPNRYLEFLARKSRNNCKRIALVGAATAVRARPTLASSLMVMSFYTRTTVRS